MKHRGIGALLLAVHLSAVGISLFAKDPKSASANSAPPYWEGSDGMGAILKGDQCPIEVKEERLSFTLSELPTWDSLDDAEKFLNYSGRFTAEYTFFNPTNAPVDLTLVFPLGTRPEYFPSDGEIDRTSLGYSIKKDGQDVEYSLRHSFGSMNRRNYDLEEDLNRLYPSTKKLYGENLDELSVKVYHYRVSVPEMGTDPYDYVNFMLSFDGSPERSRVFCSDYCNYSVKNGKAKLTHNFDCVHENPLDFCIYVLGEDISEPETAVFRYGRDGAEEDGNARVDFLGKTQTNFSDLALSFRQYGCPDASDRDWENALIDYIEENRISGSWYSNIDPALFGSGYGLMQWFEYSIAVPALGTVVNTVTAPIYPTIDGSYSQDLYNYSYLLSPAQKWAKFGRLTVDIDTPYYISDSSLEFEKREGGYTLTREKLPLGELTFTLSEEERKTSVDKNWNYNGGGGDSTLVTAIVIVCVVTIGAAVVIVVLAVQSGKKKKRREEEERKLLQARPQEGKIDLPDEENRKE